MRPKQFSDILTKELNPTITDAKMHHVGRALATLELTSGWEDLTPLAAGWMLFTAAACPHSRHLDIMMWIKDRQADQIFNQEKNRPAWALAVLLTVPNLSDQVQSIGLTPEGVMMVLDNKDELRVFPLMMMGEDRKEVEAHTVLERAHNAVVIPGAVFRSIAAKLGLVVPGAVAPSIEKVFA